MIRIKSFRKKYDDFLAVEGLTLEVGKGEIFGFIGPNGAGKTTTIRFLATLLPPTSGSARVAGHDVVREVDAVRRSIGYMPDSFGVYNGMRVWEFLDFFAVAYGVPATHRRRLIDDALVLVDLHPKRDDYVNALSRGMKQRLCLAKTLVHDPPVLILDEPASGLDPRARLEMKELLKELRRMGKTIFISSHILSELADTCNSVGIMERGELLAVGKIDSIYEMMVEHRTVTVRALNETDELERWIGNAGGVAGVTRNDGTVRFDFKGTDAELAALSDEIFHRGHRPVSISEERPSLEAIFLKITRGLVQ